MRRRRVWLVVCVLAILCAVVGVSYYAAHHEPIRVGMTENDVYDALDSSYDFVGREGPQTPDNGSSLVCNQTDFLGTVHCWSVEFDRSDRVRSFSVENHAFGARPHWLEWLWPSPSRPSPFGHARA